jgi:LPS export ABC transporter protein LptC
MMKDKLTLLIAIVLLSSVTATSYWYARSLRVPPNVNIARPNSPDKLVHFGETDDVELSWPRLVSLRPDQPQVEVRAERGRIENTGEKVHLHGDVVLTRTAAGAIPAMRVDTPYLLALPDEDKYRTDQPVLVRRGGQTISAQQGMAVDNIARTAQFEGSVKINLPAPAPQ